MFDQRFLSTSPLPGVFKSIMRWTRESTLEMSCAPLVSSRTVHPASHKIDINGSTFFCNRGCPLVEITGGEPLLQKNVLPLMSILCDGGYTVLLETSGAHDISKVDPRVHRIMDLKTPGSGEVGRNLWSNIERLTLRDEVKFVMGSREDYEWSRDKVQRYDLPSRCNAVLFSPIFGRIDPRQIVEWILADKLDVRFQLQMHKFIWNPTQRGV